MHDGMVWLVSGLGGLVVALVVAVVVYLFGPLLWASRRHPLIWLLLIVATAYAAILLMGFDRTERYIDRPMLLVITVAYFAAALIMLHRTGWAYWTALGAGLLATMTADALLYGYLLMPRIGVDLSPTLAGLWLALVRSLLVAGGPFVLVGLIREWHIDRRQDAREAEQAATGRRQAATERRQDAREDRWDDQHDTNRRV